MQRQRKTCCYYCEEWRHIGCHSHCAEYLEERKVLDEEKRIVQERTTATCNSIYDITNGIHRMRTRRHKKVQ